jgi:hypothetical protein
MYGMRWMALLAVSSGLTAGVVGAEPDPSVSGVVQGVTEALPIPNEQLGAEEAERGPSVPTTFVDQEPLDVPPSPLGQRRVVVNLVLDEKQPLTATFRRESGELLAQQDLPVEKALFFEVRILSPATETVAARFPVPADSPIRAAFEQNGVENPAPVLAEVEKLEPPTVAVVASKKLFRVRLYTEAALEHEEFYDLWRPVYAITLPAAKYAEPTLIPVPRSDDRLYQLTQGTINNLNDPKEGELILQLSGPDLKLAPPEPPVVEAPPAAEAPNRCRRVVKPTT